MLFGITNIGNHCLIGTWAIADFPWASYQLRKIAGCASAGNAGNVFPRRRFQRKPQVNDPGMHHGTCMTHVPWCMSGSLTCGDGENVPGIPGACTPAILRIWQESHWRDSHEHISSEFQLIWKAFDHKTQWKVSIKMASIASYISADCHEPKLYSLFQHGLNDNGGSACLATNSACRQWILWSFNKIWCCITKPHGRILKSRQSVYKWPTWSLVFCEDP